MTLFFVQMQKFDVQKFPVCKVINPLKTEDCLVMTDVYL